MTLENQQPHKHVGKSKFEEAFSVFAPVQTVEEIQSEIKKLIDTHYDALNNHDTISFLHSTIDLTSLGSEDNTDQIYNFVKSVNDLDDTNPTIPPVASICVYPNFAKTVKETLMVEDVHVSLCIGRLP